MPSVTKINVIDGNKTFTDLYGRNLNNVVVFGNDAVLDEFHAHVKLEFWGENYITLQEEGVKGEPTLKDEIITLDLGDRKMQWFKGPPENSSLHWVETLKEKPASNKWSLKIADADQFNYLYQRPLSVLAAQIPGSQIEYFVRGGIDHIRLVLPPGGPSTYIARPIDVDGSIVVRHTTKRDHVLGQTNYRGGIVVHIPRPKAIDKNGKWTWCDIQVKDGVYTRTIPQNFLEAAVYPIVVNDIFGYATNPASYTNLSANYQGGSGPISPTFNGNATQVSMYCAAPSGTLSITLGIWNDNSGDPDTLLDDCVGGTIDATPSWEVQALNDSPVGVLGTNSYHLGSNQGSTIEWWYTDGGDEDSWYDQATYSEGTLETCDGPIGWLTTIMQGIYVTYTPSGGGSIVPQAVHHYKQAGGL